MRSWRSSELFSLEASSGISFSFCVLNSLSVSRDRRIFVLSQHAIVSDSSSTRKIDERLRLSNRCVKIVQTSLHDIDIVSSPADYFVSARKESDAMFQSRIEETKNQLNKESAPNGTVIQNFYDGANIFITGGTGEFALLFCERR